MRISAAYMGVILIWSTTPLAIKFSTDSLSFIVAVGLRMGSAALLCLAIMRVMGRKLRWDQASIKAYAASNLGVFGAMSLSYLAVGFIPSGLLSVMFGMAPLLSGVFARWLLDDKPLSVVRNVALIIALCGLLVVFRGAVSWRPEALPGLIASLAAVALFALSGVLVKRHAGHLDALEHTTGSLLFSVPLFVLAWLLLDGQIPSEFSPTSVASVAYLSLFGSVFGFMLYFYALQALGPTQVALIPLITPVLALSLGHFLADEVISAATIGGGGMILLALALYQLGDGLRARWYPQTVSTKG